jgi:Family of unknown function (DUF6476)
VTSSAQDYAPLWLKVLVIVMGLLIVAGFVVIASEVARRLSNPPATRSPATAYSQRIALPSGAKVVSMQAAGDRLVVQVDQPNGVPAAYIVDPGSGALIGTIEFPPAAAGAARP